MAQYQLVLHVGPSPGKVFPLMKKELTIGRDINNEIVINDAEISRRHCRLTLFGDGYLIEDLGSTNGTWVNGQKVSGQHQLRPGEMVRLGDNITLAYESVGYDPAETIASAGMAAQQTPPPQQFTPAQPPPRQPQYQQAPPPVQPPYAGQVPAGPPKAPKKGGNRIWIVGCIVLIIIAICLTIFLLYVDRNCLWCEITWDLLPNCPYTGTCPPQ